MRGKFFLERVVSVGIVLTFILSANAQVVCKNKRGSMECQVGSEHLAVLDSTDTLPIKLQSEDEYILSTSSNNTECFIDRDSGVIECIVKDKETPKWHIIWEKGRSQNDRPMIEVISYLKKERGSPTNMSMYVGLSGELKENNFQSSNDLSSSNFNMETSVSQTQINVTPPPPPPPSEAKEVEGVESDISIESGVQEPSAQPPLSTSSLPSSQTKEAEGVESDISIESGVQEPSVQSFHSTPSLPPSQVKEVEGVESDISTESEVEEASAQPPLFTSPSASLLEMIPQKNRLKGDIDSDGMNETVAWKKFETTDLGDFYQLFVFDDDNRLLWKGPAVTDTENRYIFGNWDFGESLPEALLDVDGDNQAELLAPSPQSDVSPVYYRILAWNGKRFVERRPGVLMRSIQDPSRFIWVNPYPKEGYRGAWVSRIIPQNSIHRARVEVTEAKSGSYKMGKALVRFMPWGAQIIEWEQELPVVFSNQNSNSDSSNSYSYIARISSKDHYNSRGHRLRSIIEILHQDRANYYKGAGDSEDTGIGSFNTLQARRKMDQMHIVPKGIDLQKLRRVIINGTPLLRIEPDFSQNSLRVFLLQP